MDRRDFLKAVGATLAAIGLGAKAPVPEPTVAELLAEMEGHLVEVASKQPTSWSFVGGKVYLSSDGGTTWTDVGVAQWNIDTVEGQHYDSDTLFHIG